MTYVDVLPTSYSWLIFGMVPWKSTRIEYHFWYLSLSWILNCVGAKGKFCGGFDINVFTNVHQTGNGMPFTCAVVWPTLCCLLTSVTRSCRGCIPYARRICWACVQHDGRYSFLSLFLVCLYPFVCPLVSINIIIVGPIYLQRAKNLLLQPFKALLWVVA
jgi:hypothetical protein